MMTTGRINVGANPTHYGENRYYGLNIQRIIEAIRNIPENENIEEFLQKMFKGEAIYDKNDEKLSPTIEMRFRNGSSNANEILNGIRMGGQLFVRARSDDFSNNKLINSLYRQAKKRKNYVFDKVLNINRTDPNYSDCSSDEEIMRKKFMESLYGNGIIDYNTFKCFFCILYPNMSQNDILQLYYYYKNKVKPTFYKEPSIEQLHLLRDNIINFCNNQINEEELSYQYIRRAA